MHCGWLPILRREIMMSGCSPTWLSYRGHTVPKCFLCQLRERWRCLANPRRSCRGNEPTLPREARGIKCPWFAGCREHRQRRLKHYRHGRPLGGIQNLEPQVSAVQQREASLLQEIVTSRLQHRAVSPGAKAESDPTAARLVERMSSLRVMGILFVLRDFLAIFDELNGPFEFRLPTYSGIGTDLDRAKRTLRLWFFGG